MAAVWTACTKTQTKAGTETPGRATRSGVLSFITMNFFYLFPQKTSDEVACFSVVKNHHSRTTFSPCFHHKITTKNHHVSLTFSENPLKKRKFAAGFFSAYQQAV
jgi:hypothetical protein